MINTDFNKNNSHEKSTFKAEQLKKRLESQKEQLKEKAELLKEQLKEKADKQKEQLKEKAELLKEQLKENADKLKEKLQKKSERSKEKAELLKEKLREKAELLKEKLQEKAELLKEKLQESPFVNGYHKIRRITPHTDHTTYFNNANGGGYVVHVDNRTGNIIYQTTHTNPDTPKICNPLNWFIITSTTIITILMAIILSILMSVALITFNEEFSLTIIQPIAQPSLMTCTKQTIITSGFLILFYVNGFINRIIIATIRLPKIITTIFMMGLSIMLIVIIDDITM